MQAEGGVDTSREQHCDTRLEVHADVEAHSDEDNAIITTHRGGQNRPRLMLHMPDILKRKTKKLRQENQSFQKNQELKDKVCDGVFSEDHGEDVPLLQNNFLQQVEVHMEGDSGVQCGPEDDKKNLCEGVGADFQACLLGSVENCHNVQMVVDTNDLCCDVEADCHHGGHLADTLSAVDDINSAQEAREEAEEIGEEGENEIEADTDGDNMPLLLMKFSSQ